jgi:hypothetical protein
MQAHGVTCHLFINLYLFPSSLCLFSGCSLRYIVVDICFLDFSVYSNIVQPWTNNRFCCNSHIHTKKYCQYFHVILLRPIPVTTWSGWFSWITHAKPIGKIWLSKVILLFCQKIIHTFLPSCYTTKKKNLYFYYVDMNL